MDGLFNVLNNAASTFGNFLAGRSAADQAAASIEFQRQQQLAAEARAVRAAELGATTQTSMFKYGALAVAMVVVVVLLTRNKVL